MQVFKRQTKTKAISQKFFPYATVFVNEHTICHSSGGGDLWDQDY